MNDLIIFDNGSPFTSTFAISIGINAEHKAVIQLCRKYIDDLQQFGRVAFQMLPFETAGGRQEREVALLNEHQATLILTYMRNTKIVREFKMKLVKVFIKLRSNPAPSPVIPKTFADALRLAADTMEQNQQLEAKVADMQPSVDALERLTVSDGSMCMTDAAKSAGVPPRKLTKWLSENGWIYRRVGNSAWVGYQDKIQTGYLEHKVTTLHRPDGDKVVTQVRITPKGLAKISKSDIT